MQATMQQAPASLLSFQQCAQIIEHKLRSECGKTHEIETVQRRCEKGFFLRAKGRPDLTAPVALAYSLRNLPAWRGVLIKVGCFFEGFANEKPYAAVKEWMLQKTVIDRYMWTVEGNDLYIQPRPKHKRFTNEMLVELENLAAMLERADQAVMAAYVEVIVPFRFGGSF